MTKKKKDEEIKLPTTLGPYSECHKIFLNCKSDYVIFGGGAASGKTFQTLLLILKYIDDPFFRAVFIRETSTQLSQAGGLYMEAQDMWRQFGAVFKSHPQMTATFPSGAQVQFKVCGADRDITNYDGGQYSLVVFDEAQNHTDVQIRYLESRIRSKAKGPHQLIATCNPRRDSHLLPFVNAYLDQDTGIPRPEMFAKERYYGSYEGLMVFGATREELEQNYPGIKTQSYTFIAATVRDNPLMKLLNPGYVTRLENLKRVERERLLLGSWFAKETSSGYFKRDWTEIVDELPPDIQARGRGMDLASSVPSEALPNPDYTASVRLSRSRNGFYYVEHVERYRKLTNGVLESIVLTNEFDQNTVGSVPVVIPKDPGAAGAAANMFFIRHLAEHGVDARTEVVSGHAGKLSRMQPFLSIAEAGLVKVVKGEWNEMWFNELEDFVDANRKQKDDMWDATATAAKFVMRQSVVPTFRIPDMSQASVIPQI